MNKIAITSGDYRRQNFSCIYAIVSSINGKKYIGSAKHFGIRRRNHLNQLTKNKHHSVILQNHVNKYGIASLHLEVIELVEWGDLVIEREQFYLDTLHPEFNVLKIAGKTTGRKITEETRLKLIKSHTGKRPTDETRRKTSESVRRALLLLTPQKKENRKKSALLKGKKVICLNTGAIYPSANEAERQTGCDNVWMICKGYRNHSKGLVFKYYDEFIAS